MPNEHFNNENIKYLGIVGIISDNSIHYIAPNFPCVRIKYYVRQGNIFTLINQHCV